jgi:tetratricopeptide (TPR) repeat protein
MSNSSTGVKCGERTARQGRLQITRALLANALRHHRAGQVDEAERIYSQILAIDPNHSDSLHLLGMAAYHTGRPEDAIAMICKAIAVNDTVAAYHSNLGTILQAQGRLDEAETYYKRALVLDPHLAEAHYNLGNVYYAQNQMEQAAACYEHALALQPKLAEAHYNLGNARQALGKLEEALACYEQALAIDPCKYEAIHNLGNALQALGRFEEALGCYERVLALEPAYAKGHYSLASVLHAMGKLDEACASYEAALALRPDLVEAAFAESLLQLLRADFTSGWRNYEWRWKTKDHTPKMREYRQPFWSGEKLSGRLLIWGEQGIGDEIMFAGLIPDALRSGNHCVLDCDARLKPLFTRSFRSIDVVSTRASGDLADADPAHNPEFRIAAHLPSGSLPGLFRATGAAFAATTSPYLIADPIAREGFRTRYADGRLMVGLAWYTNNRRTGRIRSVGLPLFAPLLTRTDIRWVSLQYGDHDVLGKQASAAGAPLLIDRAVNQFTDIDLFAAQIAALDMVITIDNSTAHLAGALGIPTWILLPFVADWRWLLVSEDSPWYPTVRLFRQSRPGDWQSVIRQVQCALPVR